MLQWYSQTVSIEECIAGTSCGPFGATLENCRRFLEERGIAAELVEFASIEQLSASEDPYMVVTGTPRGEAHVMVLFISLTDGGSCRRYVVMDPPHRVYAPSSESLSTAVVGVALRLERHRM